MTIYIVLDYSGYIQQRFLYALYRMHASGVKMQNKSGKTAEGFTALSASLLILGCVLCLKCFVFLCYGYL
jgi:hypothetical protein